MTVSWRFGSIYPKLLSSDDGIGLHSQSGPTEVYNKLSYKSKSKIQRSDIAPWDCILSPWDYIVFANVDDNS